MYCILSCFIAGICILRISYIMDFICPVLYCTFLDFIVRTAHFNIVTWCNLTVTSYSLFLGFYVAAHKWFVQPVLAIRPVCSLPVLLCHCWLMNSINNVAIEIINLLTYLLARKRGVCALMSGEMARDIGAFRFWWWACITVWSRPLQKCLKYITLIA